MLAATRRAPLRALAARRAFATDATGASSTTTASSASSSSAGGKIPSGAAREAFQRNRARHESATQKKWFHSISREQYALILVGGAFFSTALRLTTNKTRHEREAEAIRALLAQRRADVAALEHLGRPVSEDELGDILGGWDESERALEDELVDMRAREQSVFWAWAGAVQARFFGSQGGDEEQSA
jgi:hypothetical protein